jgi:putative hydrolase of the HAD superfamily
VSAPAGGPRGFEGVDTWIFDLDNTLYPPSSRLFEQIDARMTHFIAERFGIDGLSARALQKQYYRHYGTTLRGLMDVDGVEPHAFLDFVHDIAHDRLTADPALAEAIRNLPGRRYVLTNGSRGHAERCAAALGLTDLFEDFHDIAAADFVPKPERRVYDGFVRRFGIDPARAAMFEDLARNLVVPHALGMTTVLVVPREDIDGRTTHTDDSVQGPHVDHVTHDLTLFLADLIPGPT